VAHPRSLVVAGSGSQATILETYIGAGSRYLTNAVTEIFAEDGAVIDHYKLQLEDTSAYHVATVQAQLGRDVNFTTHSLSFGGSLVRNDINAVLSEGAYATLNGLYLATGEQHVDHHTAIDHAQPHGSSRELYKGILAGRSKAVFNGKVIVRKQAQKTDSVQTNRNLVLSEDATINTKPELEIYADDVRCTHGATIGQLDPDAIFYLQTRGIDRPQARHLLTLAFAREMIDQVKVESLRNRLEQLLKERLNAQSN
jgi:Fe-S cluster assembly protein SufD